MAAPPPLPGLAVRFGLSAAVGLFAAFGVGALAAPSGPRTATQAGPVAATLAPSGAPTVPGPGGGSAAPAGSSGPGATDTEPVPSSGATPAPVPSFQLTGGDGAPITFGVTPPQQPPQPAPSLPPDQTVQLLSYRLWHDGGADQSTVRPPWWNRDVPRVQPITQFDGGPFQNANCTLASGAMLARLMFGIVTTGSQLRTLQDDQEGGTSLYDLNQALQRGWGVGFTVSALTPLQFRALIYGGAGAVLGGIYAQIPFELRLQKNFTGGHAIYIDGFRPPSADGPAAYYVIDPIGRPWEGYRGAWWPAEIIESFAMALGGGLMDAAWGFAGGAMPSRHPVLPPDAYPRPGPTGPAGSPQPGTSGGPSGSAVEDPLPTGSLPPPPDIDPGTTDQPSGTAPAGGTVETGGGEVTADPGYCARTPAPPLCPPGMVGTVIPPTGPATGTGPGSGTGTTTTGTSPPGGTSPGGVPPWLRPRLLWATLIATGTYQLVYEVTPASNLDVWIWATDAGGGRIQHAVGELATIKGRAVNVATITVDPATNWSFVASGSVRDIKGLSEVALIRAS